jgi:hypothetical protein
MRLKLKFSDMDSKDGNVKFTTEEKIVSKPTINSIYCNRDLIKRFSLNLKSIKNIFGYPLLVYSWSAI